jgi:hypothetical protein
MKQMRRPIVGILLGLLLLTVGCDRIIYSDGPYIGRVIDKETKKPIEGAVVLAVWQKESPSIGHYVVSYYDAQETLTDARGNFTIPGITLGRSLNPLAKIREPLFTIFKPGYAAYGGWVFKPRSVPESIEVRENTGLTVYALGRLTTREQRLGNLDAVRVFDCAEAGTCPNLIRVRNIERIEIGLKPTHVTQEGDK